MAVACCRCSCRAPRRQCLFAAAGAERRDARAAASTTTWRRLRPLAFGVTKMAADLANRVGTDFPFRFGWEYNWLKESATTPTCAESSASTLTPCRGGGERGSRLGFVCQPGTGLECHRIRRSCAAAKATPALPNAQCGRCCVSPTKSTSTHHERGALSAPAHRRRRSPCQQRVRCSRCAEIKARMRAWRQRAADDVIAQPSISTLNLAARRRVLRQCGQCVSSVHRGTALVDKSLEQHKIDNLAFQRYFAQPENITRFLPLAHANRFSRRETGHEEARS